MVMKGIVLESIPEGSYNDFFWISLFATLIAMIIGLGTALFIQFPFFALPLLVFLGAVLIGSFGLGFVRIFLRIGLGWWRNWMLFSVTWFIRFIRRWVFFYA